MSINRRELLLSAAGALGLTVVAACSSSKASPRASSSASSSSASSSSASSSSASSSSVATRHSYGPDPSQFGELYRASGIPRPGVIVVIHGGFWQSEYGLEYGTPLAQDLAARGYTTFNLEYRRVGNGGGWPATLHDVAAGIDSLHALDVDLTRVVAVGHSAGGQLAVWAAGRPKLPAGAPGAGPSVAVTAVVAQAGVLDLATAATQQVGGSAESDFLGGLPAQVPERYAVADPIKAVPLAAPVLCVHSRADRMVPFTQSEAYVAAAKATGATATLAEVQGDHFALIDPKSPAWATVLAALPHLLA